MAIGSTTLVVRFFLRIAYGKYLHICHNLSSLENKKQIKNSNLLLVVSKVQAG